MKISSARHGIKRRFHAVADASDYRSDHLVSRNKDSFASVLTEAARFQGANRKPRVTRREVIGKAPRNGYCRRR